MPARDVATTEPCEHLPWDSDFWGFPIARVRGHSLTPERVEAIDSWCQERGITCLYFLATFDDPLTVRCAEDGGFRLVDARVAAVITPARFAASADAAPSAEVVIRHAIESDVESLQAIAGKSYRTSRFYFDEHFPRDKCGQFYEHWIAASCRGYADVVLVAALGGTPVGYATCILPTGNAPARIGLIDVAPHAQRRGVGQALIGASLDWFAQRGVHHVTGVTQARNRAIQAFNNRLGFVTLSFQLWYHKWYRPPGEEVS
jgi:dTDP-4-amino-4,6-dideoxy-D-galactose acyltransferase